MSVNPLQGIVQFNIDRGLTAFDHNAEFNMLSEELNEYKLAPDEYETLDALCDIIVVATGAIHKLGYSPQLAINETVKEITSRKGSFNETTGKWMKDLSQDPSTLYKADYNLARR